MATEKSNEFFPNSKRVYVSGSEDKNLRVPFREIELHPTQTFNGEMEVNEPLRVMTQAGRGEMTRNHVIASRANSSASGLDSSARRYRRV